MPEKRLLDETRSNLGPPPRRLGAMTRLSLRAWRPLWLDLEDGLETFFQWQYEILTEGRVVWGCLVQANSLLFEAGRSSHPALVVYGKDPALDDELPWLRLVAGRLFALKGTEPADPEERRMAALITDEVARGGLRPVPKRLSDGRDLRVMEIFCVRKHLPDRRLRSTWVPLLIHPVTPNVMIVPHRFWPVELMARWLADNEPEPPSEG